MDKLDFHRISTIHTPIIHSTPNLQESISLEKFIPRVLPKISYPRRVSTTEILFICARINYGQSNTLYTRPDSHNLILRVPVIILIKSSQLFRYYKPLQNTAIYAYPLERRYFYLLYPNL